MGWIIVFDEGRNVDLDEIICSGIEDELQECEYDIVNDCVGHEAAGVYCNDY